MKKTVRFKGKYNNTIVYSKGMTDSEIISVLEKRISKRQIELDKRKWIYDEYISLCRLQDLDVKWLNDFKNGFSVMFAKEDE